MIIVDNGSDDTEITTYSSTAIMKDDEGKDMIEFTSSNCYYCQLISGESVNVVSYLFVVTRLTSPTGTSVDCTEHGIEVKLSDGTKAKMQLYSFKDMHDKGNSNTYNSIVGSNKPFSNSFSSSSGDFLWLNGTDPIKFLTDYDKENKFKRNFDLEDLGEEEFKGNEFRKGYIDSFCVGVYGKAGSNQFPNTMIGPYYVYDIVEN